MSRTINSKVSANNENETHYILKGDICYSETLSNIVTFKDSYLVCKDGKSKGVFNKIPSEYKEYKVYDYSNKLIIPGMVDLHIHAPQYSFRGMGMDMELMDWLQNYTFPEEKKYKNIDYAKKSYEIFSEKIRKSATTNACIFATNHIEATKILMDYMENTGINSYVGMVNMDREAPKDLCDINIEESYNKTVQWISEVSNKYKNTKPILTPRFVPCCTSNLLECIGKIQHKYNLPVQSHLSENFGEIEFVKKEYPKIEYYAGVYDKFNLFGINNKNGNKFRTIMAHCVHSSKKEIELLRDNDVFVAHCPTSNTNLASGIAPIRQYIEEGVKVGLGSDVAGGHTESMFSVICSAVQVSKLYWRLIDSTKKPLTFGEAFYLSTKGGGEFFGKVGSFEKNYDFNAIILDDSSLNHINELTIEQRLESSAYQLLDLYGIVAKFGANGLYYEEK